MAGYKDPPINTQFKPGSSGNPTGRPKTKPLTDALRRILEMPAGEAFAAETKAEQLAHNWFMTAMGGDVSALKEALNRLEGKTPDRVIVDDEQERRRISIGRRRRPGDPGDGAAEGGDRGGGAAP